MTQEGIDGEARVSRGELVPVGPPESLQDWAELLVARAREDGVALTGGGRVAHGPDEACAADRARGRPRATPARAASASRIARGQASAHGA